MNFKNLARLFYRTSLRLRPRRQRYFTQLLPSTSSLNSTSFYSTKTSNVSIDEQKKRIEQMNEYFSQYVDEYYEEDEVVEVEKEEEIRETVDLNRPDKDLVEVDEVVKVLEELKAKNVEVVHVEKENAPFSKLVIASPFTNRHGAVLVEEVRLHFTKKYNFGRKNPSRVKQQNGWYILDFHNLVLHIMAEPLRERYNLASLWTEEENDFDKQLEDETFIPLKEEKAQ